MPDMVISDVMMPELDGFNFCRMLKEDIRTSHIPVVLLTAKAGHDNQLTGLQQGADLYIAKPFSLQLVQLQLKNLLATREAMRLRLSTQLLQVPEQNIATADTQEDYLQGVSTADKAFLQQLLGIIDEQMDNPEFNVAMLSMKMALSQPILYKKVKALTNMTVNDFVKSLRLKKAATLLLDKEMNISEVAYSVGFNRRKYFSEEFKKAYGKTPTEYVNEHEG
jgi:YesN/AraC family two-component response regulator